MARARTLSENLTPRGLDRVEAAQYVGVGVTLFDRLVSQGLMPNPKRAASRKVWDVKALDRCFDALPDDGSASSWAGVE
jgi:hypothetical protein